MQPTHPELYESNILGKYLLARGLSAYDFSKTSYLRPATIYRILKGFPVRKDIAKRIVRATKKELTLEDFGYATKQKA